MPTLTLTNLMSSPTVTAGETRRAMTPHTQLTQQETQAETPQARRFDIPAQDLGTALTAFADAANLRLLFTSALVAGKRSTPISGTYTPIQALTLLLQGTGLAFQFTDSRTISIVTSAAASRNLESVTLPETQVEGQAVKIEETQVTAERERTYVAKDATTATKTDTPIFDLPVSIQVVPREVMDDQQVIRVRDAVKNVSGVYVRPAGGDQFEDFFVRGFPLFFQLYRDGFRQRGFKTNTAALERIEVLKGPAAVLYGRIEPGGLVNLVSKQPLATPYYSLQQQFGSFNLYRTSVDATGPLTEGETLLYRFNLSYENADSFRDFITADEVFLAPVLTWKLSERTWVRFNLEYLNADRTRDRGLVAFGDRPAPIPRTRNLSEPFGTEDLEDLTVGFLWSHDFTPNWTLRHRFTFEKPDNHPVEVGATDFFLEDNRSVARFFFEEKDDAEFYYTALELTGHVDTRGIKHTLLLGADYYHTDIDFGFAFADFTPIDIFAPVYGTPRPDLPLFSGSRGEEWYGIYLQDQIDLLDNVHLLLGGRYDNAESFSVCCGSEAAKSMDGADDFSPRVGLVYQPLTWLALYGNYVESFSSADDFSRSFSGEDFDPETATQYEVGLKTDFFDGRLFSTLAWYDLTKKNILTDDPEHPGFSVAIGEARSRGIELDVAGSLTPAFSVIASYAYTDTKITKDNSGNEGNRLPGVPLNGGSFWGVYEFSGEPLRGFRIGTGVFAVGRRDGDPANTFQVPGYTRIDMLAAYRRQLGNFTLTAQLNIENLADEKYFLGAQNRSSILPGAPRSFFGSLRLEF